MSLFLVPWRQEGLIVLRLRARRSACLHAYSEEKGRARTHTCAIWEEKIEYHPELEEHDSKELVIFSALQKSLI